MIYRTKRSILSSYQRNILLRNWLLSIITRQKFMNIGLNYTLIIYVRSIWWCMEEKQLRRSSKNVLSVREDSGENQLHNKWLPYLPYD